MKTLCFSTIRYGIIGTVLGIPVLLIVAGAAYFSRYYERKVATLVDNGIVTTATVYDAGYDKLGSFLQGNADNKTGKSGYQRNDSAKCMIYYRFVTEDGEQVEGSINREYASLDDAKLEIGTEIDIVYSANDPSVFETGVGHTKSQASAMYWIAVAFLVIYLLMVMAFLLIGIVLGISPDFFEDEDEQAEEQAKQAGVASA